MATNDTNADPVPVGSDTTTEAYRRDLTTSLISLSIVGGLIIFTILTIWIIWRKFCKSPRSRHGNEKIEGTGSGKTQYYDQFKVNDHQLTVNSVTAIKWEEDEKRSNKSSGIDCDSHSGDSREERKVVSSKRVFSVNKVPERQSKTSSGGGVVIRLPKQYADITRSLQAGDGKNYTLAIIDKHSQTIHNLDMRNYRLRRAVSPLSTISSSGVPGRVNHKRHRHRSDDNRSEAQSAGVLLHDSPDFSASRRRHDAVSAVEMKTRMTSGSLTDFSDSGNSATGQSSSLSSHEDECSKGLTSLPAVKITGPEAAVPTDDEQENLLTNCQ